MELQKLVRRGLDRVRVFHALYRHRVAPLVERACPMWRYSGASDPDCASPKELPDDEVWSRLDQVLQLKPKEKVEGKPIPLNATMVSKLVCSSFFTSCSFPPLLSNFFDLESPVAQGLDAYRSRPHLSKGPEGTAQ